MNLFKKTSLNAFSSVYRSSYFMRNGSFKSAIALEKLYPDSTLKLTTPKVVFNLSLLSNIDE